MATTSNEIKIGIGDQVITLSGAELEAFEADRASIVAYDESLKTERATAKAALLERLGITADEAALLLG